MRRHLRIFLTLLFAIMLAGINALGEEILLKDGTKISGKITAVKDDSFQVKTAYGEIQIPRKEIVSINFPENQPKPEAEEEKTPAPVDESLEGNVYLNRTARFRLTIPDGWVLFPDVRKNAKDVVAALSSPDRTLLFLVTPEVFTSSLSAYKGLAEVQYQTKFGNYQKISESEVEVDGRKGVKLVWKATNPNAENAPMKSLVIILPYDGRFVRLTFLTLEPLYDDAVAKVEKMMMSYTSLPK